MTDEIGDQARRALNSLLGRTGALVLWAAGEYIEAALDDRDRLRKELDEEREQNKARLATLAQQREATARFLKELGEFEKGDD